MPILNFKLAARVQATFGDSLGSIPLPEIIGDLLTSFGVGATEADSFYQGRRVIAASGSPDLIDLAGGTLYGYGPLGANTLLSFASVVAVFIVNRDAARTITVGGGSNGVFSWQVPILPGGVHVLGAPGSPAYPVTAGTGDILRSSITAGANVPFDLAIAGRSS